MNKPQPGDYINIHTHGASASAGIFTVDNLMAHEGIKPGRIEGIVYSCGIHPWYLNENNQVQLIKFVRDIASDPALAAIGEAGFDKLRGPSLELQSSIFEQQVFISEEHRKPLFIHCVRAWDELLAARKRLKPEMPWMVHGFRGSIELADQLISKGFFLSFWFDFVIRSESSALLKSLPTDRIFLETDGADVDIRDIYNKVSADLSIDADELKSILFSNYNRFFKI